MAEKKASVAKNKTTTNKTSAKKKHHEFLEPIKKGKEVPADMVEAALLKKTLGYEEYETKTFQYEGEPVYAPFTKSLHLIQQLQYSG